GNGAGPCYLQQSGLTLRLMIMRNNARAKRLCVPFAPLRLCVRNLLERCRMFSHAKAQTERFLCTPHLKGDLMRLRKLIPLCMLALLTVIPAVAQTRDEQLWRRAQQIHRRAIVVDTHNDVTTPMTNDDFDLSGTPPTPYRTNIERMKKGGLTAEFFSLYVIPCYVDHGGSARRTLDMIDSVYRAVERHPRDLMFATSVADIRRAKRTGKIAALMGIEGGHAIEDSLPTLREFYRLGVRYMTLTWNNTNNWADANRPPKKHNGLSDFGKEVVREMNRLGMLVDISHVSDDTMNDVLDVSTAPVIASHSSARALSNVPRNIPD